MTASQNLSNLSLPRKLLLGAAAVLFINSFLPWYSVDLGPFGSATANGWHEIGPVVWLLVIALLVLEGTRIAGVLPLDEGKSDLATLAVTAGALLFGLIFVIQRLTDGHFGFGFFVGVIGLVVLGVGGFLLYQAGGAMQALKSMQGSKGPDAAA
ncbi:hypothetical protein [Nocardioides sp. AE5]|uniref:hypothetical protein n=1 Tax=Nocardioides sp. AE5 TaxID=2962573 RepID=UPI0028821E81|nr:hypothetical protein [Nocardioides sp. AE5]MDT0200488.1 hypothetical protein [Nocardioides sp. AE5]